MAQNAELCATEGTRDVVWRFLATTSSSDRIGLRRTVGGGGETYGRRRGHAGTEVPPPARV